jgi:arabinofuranosyltransferase
LSKKKFNKKVKAAKQQQELSGKAAGLIYTKQLNKKFKYLFVIPVVLTIAAGIYFVVSAFKTNGYFGFPIDDAWIHLTFAKNIFEYGSFSYYKNELATSGSTSPLYTMLLSLFFFISTNEFVISYLLGIIFGAALVLMMVKLSLLNFKSSSLLAILTSLLIALQPKLNLISVTGMETSMFIFLISASLYAYQKKKIVMLGILLGFTIWCRPDGFVLWIAIALDHLLNKTFLKKNSTDESATDISYKKISITFFIAALFAAAYFIFNYSLSGSILPNTYKAKIEYYQQNIRTFFLEHEVLDYFTEGELVMIWLPFLIYVLVIARSFIRKEYNSYLPYLLFIVGLILAYYIKLPFSHRFGRYLLPVMPFYILVAVAGFKTVLEFIQTKISKRSSLLPNSIFILYSLTAIYLSAYYTINISKDYAFICKYHNDRHVAAGKWINKNTGESDVIAAHDIGAIAFYGERKIIDMAGLVTPELVAHINDRMYSEYMNNYLAKHKVDYIVTLRNWFEVVNDKPVFFPVNEFEFLEIFKYDPGRTHIQAKEATLLNQKAIELIQRGLPFEAIPYLQQSLRVDPKSSRTNFLIGAAYESINDLENAKKHFSRAVELYPDFEDAYFGLAKINFVQNNLEESYRFVKKCLALNPDYTLAIELKNRLDSQLKK